MSAAEIRFAISEMLECRMRRHYDRFVTFVDPGVMLYCHSWREGMVGPGVWEGVEGLRELFRRTDKNYLPGDHEIIDVLVDGNEAAVRWRADWTRHENGRVYMNDAAHFLRWENGRVIEMHEFFDAHCHSTPASSASLASFESLCAPRLSGLSREEMARRARRLLDLEIEGPATDLIHRWCAPDIVCDFAGDRARLPYAGRHTGSEALAGIIRAVNVDFEQQALGFSKILIEGDSAACWRQVAWRHRGTGRAGVCELADFIRFENGLIVELIEFRDTVSLVHMQD